MKIFTKLTLGVGALFVLIIVLSIIGIKFSNDLKKETESILQSNYNTLQYLRNMLIYLDDSSEASFNNFAVELNNQEKNISEIGEQKVTNELRNYFDQYRLQKSDSLLRNKIRAEIYQLMNLNMQAIERKGAVAKKTADKAVFWITVAGTLCFLVAFVLLINLPSSIASPIKELTESIKEIADKNYTKRVHFKSNSEFGQLANSFNTMAEKLQEYNNSNVAKLMMEKKRIEALITNMHDPVIGLDNEFRIIFINEEALKIVGLPQEELIGQYAKEIAINNDLIRTLLQDLVVDKSKITDQKNPMKIYYDNKEGYFEKEYVQISVTPTGEHQAQMIGHVIVLRNITAHKELEFAKTNFIATLSHEIKTPISSIGMSVVLLKNNQIGNLNAEQSHLVESINEDTKRLLKITGELLNMSQVESGNMQLALMPTDPTMLLELAVKANQIQADQKLIQFDVASPEGISKVMADPEKTVWVLSNLISNAIRYSYDNSTIFIGVQDKNNKVEITVRDTGQGIAPQYEAKIFERYFRVPGTKKEGTGLGLSISKELIEAQGGSIFVESEYGAGSTFTLTLTKSV